MDLIRIIYQTNLTCHAPVITNLIISQCLKKTDEFKLTNDICLPGLVEDEEELVIIIKADGAKEITACEGPNNDASMKIA